MCAAHWRLVPLALRRAVRRANQERGGVGGNALYLPYLDACAQAVEIVAHHEMRCPENSFRRAAILLEQHLGQAQAAP
jgi:hypothetical protein